MKAKLFVLLCFVCVTAKAQSTHILPTPQQVEWQKGSFTWDETRIDYRIVRHLDVPRNEDQAYRLTIAPEEVIAEATTETGLFYARQSLNQLRRSATLIGNGRVEIPCMTILDWPDLKLRGWQDDISRGPIVTMDYLKQLIPQLAECKLNAFSLYTEHTFRTESHPDAAPIDAFTADEIRELDAFCKQYHIELIGNQQCFAHFEEILKNPFYAYLADAPDNLNPGIEATYEFLDDLIGEEAQAYSSPLFNINCDETESLGSGRAKAYVDSVGRAKAYWQHINRVNEIVRRHGKQAMMWGDIADQDPEILDNLDKDIVLLAWTYAGRDSYDNFLQPYVDSGHEFMVVPGCSMSGWVLPYQSDYLSNIPHLCRDGFLHGASGVINTSWDDFGESLINSALYPLALGAEMSWNPIKKTQPEQASAEERQRSVPWNFCIHFLDNPTPTCASYQAMESVGRISEINGIGRFSSLWEPMTPFYPSQVGDSVERFYQTLLSNEIYQSQATRNASLFDHVLYALHRIEWCARRNIARCQLYRTYQNPTSENVVESRRQIDSLLVNLHRLKCDYIELWERESRPCWLEVNMNKYDRLARELMELPYQPFIESGSDNEGHVTVMLGTVYHDHPVHYTLDGKEVVPSDPVYTQPLVLSQSGLVKAACFDPQGHAARVERYFLHHKGMGKLRKLHSVPGNYRPEYSGGGDNALVDGHLGSGDYKDGHWQGFYGTDADLELDFRQVEDLRDMEIGFLVNAHDWILRADEVELYTSSDGQHYQWFKTHQITTEITHTGNFIFRERIPVDGLSTRYLRVVVKNPGLIPEGLPGYGYDSWVFMDEIIIQ